MVARPLHDMVKKDKKWEWTERQEETFKELKKRFTEEPVLVAPDIDKKMRMEVDASDYAMGGVLSMECGDGLWRPVAFLSKSLNETERNYEIHDKEMLAIIRGLEAWRHLLEGAQYKFEIWTDHKNLEYFMKVQKLNRRQARWALYLSWFDFILKHVAGTKIRKADMSRSLTVDFILFSFLCAFYFYFSIFRTTQVRGYQSRCHISHKLMVKSQD